MFGIKNVKSQKMLIVTVISSVVLILVGIGIYLWLKSKNKKSSITPVPTTPPITTPPITTQPQITTSIFKDTKPPFGIYYISDPSNNSIITVEDTKVVFESKFNNVYTKSELTNPFSSKDFGKFGGVDGTYIFGPIAIQSYKLYVTIWYSPSNYAYKEPYVSIEYLNPSTNQLVKSFNSAKGVNNKPASFIHPSSITQPPITQPPIPITQPPIPITQPPTCTDNDNYTDCSSRWGCCKTLAAQGACSTSPNFMNLNCKKSCGICTVSPITTSIFTDTKPPFGSYYISDGSNNSIITIDDTKVVFESKYENVYTKKELTNPVSAKNGGFDGTYYFKDIDIKSYKLFITILYIPSMQAYKEPFVMISYYNPSNNALVKSFNSAKGVNNKPSSFIQPSP